MTVETKESAKGSSDSTYSLGTWRLDELLPDDDPATEREALARLEERVVAFEATRAQLESIETGDSAIEERGVRLLDILYRYEELVEEAYRLGAYGSLRFAADTQSESALAYQNRIRGVLTDRF